MSLAFITMDSLWRNALGVIPIVILVALICRWLPCRPSTRHALWLIALLSLLAPPILPELDCSTILHPFRSAALEQSDQIDGPLNNGHSPMHVPLAQTDQRIAHNMAPLITAVPATNNPAEPISQQPVAPSWLAPVPISPQTKVSIAPSEKSAHALSLPSTGEVWSLPRMSPPQNLAQADRECQATRNIPNPPIYAGWQFQDFTPRAIGADSIALEHVAPPAPLIASELSWTSSLSKEWRDWLSRVVVLRDTIAGLAPIPPTLWLGGTILLGLIIVIRIVRFRRIFAAATDAPPSVRRLAVQAAAVMGLHSVPQIKMVSRRISPLVWCGPRKCLILPADLWSHLDDIGRRAVLTHELAHLKRRDHWVCWAEMIVGCLYWWHPVVWWIRRRIRDEADFCCDAWVTSLVPAGRRAYALALLATRQYVKETQHAVPAVGLGATTTHAKRFARRLTMVMTDRPMPRLSMWGCALAICLATGAWLSTPLWACPPESSGSSGGECTPNQTVRIAKPRSPRATVNVPAPAQGAPDVTTFETYMSGRDNPRHAEAAAELARRGRDDARQAEAQSAEMAQRGNVEARLNRLEEQLNRLTHQIEALMQHEVDQVPPPGGGAGGRPGLRMRSPVLAPRPSVPAQPPVGTGAISAPLTAFGFAAPDNGETVARVYRLPQGKREALIQFMSRSDVPILVGSDSEGIEVHATPRQHEIFGAFIELIHPSPAAENQTPVGQGPSGGAAGLLLSAPDLEATARRYVEAAKTIARHMTTSNAKAIADSMSAHQRSAADHLRQLNQKTEELFRKAAILQQQSSEVGSRALDAIASQAREALRAQADQLATEAQALQEQGNQLQEQASELRDQLDQEHEALEESLEENEARIREILEESGNGN